MVHHAYRKPEAKSDVEAPEGHEYGPKVSRLENGGGHGQDARSHIRVLLPPRLRRDGQAPHPPGGTDAGRCRGLVRRRHGRRRPPRHRDSPGATRSAHLRRAPEPGLSGQPLLLEHRISARDESAGARHDEGRGSRRPALRLEIDTRCGVQAPAQGWTSGHALEERRRGVPQHRGGHQGRGQDRAEGSGRAGGAIGQAGSCDEDHGQAITVAIAIAIAIAKAGEFDWIVR